MSVGKVLNGVSFPQISNVAGRGEIGGISPERKTNALDSFGELVTDGIGKVNTSLTDYEKISKQFSMGEKVNVHELMVKGEQADMSLRLMLSLRNKIVEAYQEVMRLPV